MKKYTIHLSSRQTVEIDEDDFHKLTSSGERGSLLKLKQAIINPSFIIAIVPLKEGSQKKIKGHVDPITGDYVIDEEHEVIEPLQDEFEGRIGATKDNKLIG